MPRNMSFFITTEQFRNRTKNVTRRLGWKFLLPGDVVMGVRKGMGLKKGEKVEELGLIRILANSPEPLEAITPDEVIREGFPGWTPEQFIKMFVDHSRIDRRDNVNRIEFEYL